jgi:hypothetical protein
MATDTTKAWQEGYTEGVRAARAENERLRADAALAEQAGAKSEEAETDEAFKAVAVWIAGSSPADEAQRNGVRRIWPELADALTRAAYATRVTFDWREVR